MKTHLIHIGTKLTYLIILSISVILMGCEKGQQQAGVLTPTTPIQANAVISSSNESGVSGMAVFTQDDDQITLIVEIQGATPGLHAVHIHANGDCSAPDGSSAGVTGILLASHTENGEMMSSILETLEISPSRKMEQVVLH